MLNNPFWWALTTEQARFALGERCACRYPADVIPFAGLEHSSAKELAALSALLVPDEEIFVQAERVVEVDDLVKLSELPCLQLHFTGTPDKSDPPFTPDTHFRQLGPEDAVSMVSLTNLAFPGFFRARTYLLGAYFGIFRNSELIAMAGERIAIPGMREISAVCTHPDHTGQGYAQTLIQHLLRVHAERGLRSFLHVAEQNARAIRLYQHLGFEVTAALKVHQLRKLGR
jgi:ribosomal protein S18 acetylase RimI-like enzyme